jgi:hypothetical protein
MDHQKFVMEEATGQNLVVLVMNTKLESWVWQHATIDKTGSTLNCRNGL